MKEITLLNKVRELLGMEIKLEQRKLEDGVTIIEADAFEAEAEVVIITEDEQRIPLPIGEYKMEDGMILVVAEEGIIAEIKEEAAEEEVIEEEAEKEYEEKEEEMATEEAKPVKKVVESVSKETYFTEITITSNVNGDYYDTVNATFVNGDFSLIKDSFYTLELRNGTEVVHKDKIFVTDQTPVVNYSVNDGEYISNVSTNEFIIYE